jgi:hypothetical protein
MRVERRHAVAPNLPSGEGENGAFHRVIGGVASGLSVPRRPTVESG